MRILDVRAGKEKFDIANGQAVLQSEISHPAKTVMIIRGTGPDTSIFADRASARATAFPWREVVWVKSKELFSAGQEAVLFPASYAGYCGVILDLADRPTVWLKEDSSVPDIEDAFLVAGSRR